MDLEACVQTRPTQADVARLAGVSRQTVSLVARDDPRVSQEKRTRVHEAMERLGYRINAAARALASRRTGFVGIVLSEYTNPFHADLVDAMRRRCEKARLIPFIAPVDDTAADELNAITRFAELNVEGLVLISPMLDEIEIESIGRDIATVVVTRNQAPKGVDVVHSDDRTAGRLATEHLIEAGYETVVFLGYDRPVPGDSSIYREESYRSVIKEHNLRAQSYVTPKESFTEVARQIIAEHGANTGVVCHNDFIATEVLGVLGEFGLRPGVDVGVVGFDNTRISSLPGISLTTIDQQWLNIANSTIDLLVERITQGRTESVDVSLLSTLIVRGSSTR